MKKINLCAMIGLVVVTVLTVSNCNYIKNNEDMGKNQTSSQIIDKINELQAISKEKNKAKDF